MTELFVPIIGTENEYGSSRPGADLGANRILKQAISSIPRQQTPFSLARYTSEIWGHNGSRLYPDIHVGFEYATPECLTPEEAVVHELAGPHFINRIFKFSRVTTSERVWIIKNNNPPGPGKSYGNHVNVQMLLKGEDPVDCSFAFSNEAAALVVALPLVVGAGLVMPAHNASYLRGPDFSYRISARSIDIGILHGGGWGNANTGKPIFLQRNDPLGNDKMYWRLQVIGLDSNILPGANLVKLTMIQLAAEMYYAGQLRPLYLHTSVGALRRLSQDWRRTHAIRGRSPGLTALEILQYYYDQFFAYAYANNREMYFPGLRELKFQLDAFEESPNVPPPSLIGHNDWVTKYYYILRGAHDFDSAEQIHLAYHAYELGKNFGQSWPHRLIENNGWPGISNEINRAVYIPPATRALARSRFIEAVVESQSYYNTEFSWVKAKVNRGITAHLPDPKVTTTPVLERLIESLTNRPGA